MRAKLIIVYGLLVAAALLACLAHPVAFQKSNAIVGVTEIEPLRGSLSFDVASRIAAIPYRESGSEVVWAVEPRARYRDTVLQGRGNCSNLVFGLAYELDRMGIDYQIIHLLPEDFLAGSGHTVLRIRFRYGHSEQIGVVDVLEGGLPASQGRFIDVEDLIAGPVPEFNLVALNERQDERSEFYGASLLGAHVGYIPASEMRVYFRFIEAVYVPFGSPRLEKYLYDGLAVVLGAYPNIHAPDFTEVYAEKRAERLGYVAACWVLRSAFMLAPAYLALRVVEALAALRRTLHRSVLSPQNAK